MAKLKNISVRFPSVACNPTLEDGTTANPFWNDIELTRILGVAAPFAQGDDLVFTGITNQDRLPPAKMLGIIAGVPAAFGGKIAEVYGYACWIKLQVNGETQDMPASTEAPVVVTNAEADPPTTRTRKWSEAHQAREVEGFWYAPCTNGGAYWNGTDIAQVLADVPGSSLVTKPPTVDAEV